MADLLSLEQISELREAFSVFDKDGDGSITVHDVTEVFSAMGQPITVADAARMVAEADADANGTVDFPEFLTMVASRMHGHEDTEKELLETFRHYDISHTGYITASNLTHVMAKMGCRLTPEEAEEMIREADVDMDGRLSFDDFRRIMLSGTK